MIRAILFDLGNTLLEYDDRTFEGLFDDAVSTLHGGLASRGASLPDADAFGREFEQHFAREKGRGGATEDVVVRALRSQLGHHGIDPTSREFTEFLRPFHDTLARQVIPYPDTTSTLVKLRQAGLRLGIVANTSWPKEFHLRDLARFELLPLLDELAFSSDLGMHKPDPRIFRHVMDRLDLAPDECVFVGDHPREDTEGARAAGMRAILKFHPRAPRPRRGMRPDARIEALNQLPALIETWNPALA